MSSPIHFMGKDYASVDDMPANIRMLYDKASEEGSLDEVWEALGEAQAALDSVQSEESSHPWSKSESGGIAVPAGFQNVTNLGPAQHFFTIERSGVPGYMIALGIGLGLCLIGPGMAGVALLAGDPATAADLLLGSLIPLVLGGGLVLLGLWNFWSFWTGVQALVTYRDGFAFRKGGTISAWAWSEIAAILSKEKVHISSRGNNWTSQTYLVSSQKGETITLSNAHLQDIPKLINILKQRAFAAMLPSYQQTYQSGQPVTFGPVTVSKPNGFTANGKQIAWSEIANVEVKNGTLMISTKQAGVLGDVHTVRASKIPNIEILCQLIGIDPWMIDLSYI